MARSLAFLAFAATSSAFAPQLAFNDHTTSHHSGLAMSKSESTSYVPSSISPTVDTSATESTEPLMTELTENSMKETAAAATRSAPKKISKRGVAHKEGVFSPVVKIGKVVLGEQRLNKVRGKVIAMHSDVISAFVETSDSEFGKAVLTRFFELMDKNKDGTLDEEEVTEALRLLGFSWLKEKQILGIMKRADSDSNGVIDFEEFVNEAPKTLRTNLTKLAKKNGGDMGLLV